MNACQIMQVVLPISVRITVHVWYQLVPFVQLRSAQGYTGNSTVPVYTGMHQSMKFHVYDMPPAEIEKAIFDTDGLSGGLFEASRCPSK